MDKRDQFGLDEGGQFELDERGQDGLDFPSMMTVFQIVALLGYFRISHIAICLIVIRDNDSKGFVLVVIVR